jgi:capsular exopolysaccharide synthesis family protein
MSRVDEALRRAAEPVAVGPRSIPRAGDQGAVDEWTLEQYPREAVAPPAPSAAPAAPVRPLKEAGTASRLATYRRAEGPPSADVRPANAPVRLVGVESGPVAAEQYRKLAATLHDAQAERGLKTVLVTSAVPQEGKTFTVANLAVTLAESYGRRVLLIDADLRRPNVHNLFGIANTTGLSEVLGSDRLDVPFVHLSPLLSVLTAGRPGPAPLAALVSERMRVLLHECASEFDWVLLDAPPVGLLSDAQLLTRQTDAVVFVIAAGVTPYAMVERAVADLGRDAIIGTVLNRVDERTIPVAGYYGHYADFEAD